MYRVEGWLVDAEEGGQLGCLQESEQVLSDVDVGDEWPAPAEKVVNAYWVAGDSGASVGFPFSPSALS